MKFMKESRKVVVWLCQNTLQRADKHVLSLCSVRASTLRMTTKRGLKTHEMGLKSQIEGVTDSLTQTAFERAHPLEATVTGYFPTQRAIPQGCASTQDHTEVL